ncbi:MAG TPA: endolytic transglycosylase MltG [Woeseiaceae bacterium]|nr:endolytic transglycosylase MltG [Woeseiaceae bacterium]
MRRLLWLAVGVAALGALLFAWQAHRFLHAPLAIDEGGEVFEIPAGTPFVAVSRALAERGIIEHPRLFTWYARLKGQGNAIRAGEYWLEPGLTPRTLLAKLVAGNVLLHSFTIVEGWTFRELLANLRRHEAVASTLEYEDWPRLMEELGADYEFPEGLFLPETYRFARNTSDVEVLRRAYRLMQETLDEEWENRAPDLPFDDKYQALILASIVEKETGRADERARIAGVFVRRLQRGMRLQTDPTVIYGIGEAFDGNLTRAHLRTDTPYNTYTRSSLPPTPIAMPGRAAIHAALNPAPGEELFFVATGLGDGSHKFSVTREEHDAAVLEYLERLRQARKGSKP